MPNHVKKKSIDPTGVDVWYFNRAYAPEISLHPQEQQRVYSFIDPQHQRRQYNTYAIVKTILSYYLELLPHHSWTFELNAYGKPYLKDYPHCHFNWSHSQNDGLFAINFISPLGIDIEHHKSLDYFAVGQQCFSKEEFTYLQTLPHHQLGLNFFKLWTLKEAYIKALGLGFSYPSSEFCVWNLPVRWWMLKPNCHAALCADPDIENVRFFKF
jgi:4'-phosphopantetheinyl transferase